MAHVVRAVGNYGETKYDKLRLRAITAQRERCTACVRTARSVMKPFAASRKSLIGPNSTRRRPGVFNRWRD